MDEKCFQVGYAKAVLTPPMGMKIPGHGFMPRPAEGIIDDVHVYALAFSDGENKAILFNVDALGVLSSGGQRIREKVAERCQIPVENVYLACTHCHTAMWVGGDLDDPEDEERDRNYFGHQDNLFCDVAQFAMEDLKPATMKIARGQVKGVGFIRRFKMADGTLKTNPGYMRPDIVEPDGEQDEGLQLVRMEREGGKEIVIVNFSVHPDVVGGRKISPDWPGYVVDVVEAGLENKAHVVMLNGFSGDSNHCNRFKPKPTVTGLEFAKRMARKIGGEALKVYDDAEEIPTGNVAGFMEIATFGMNPYEEWEVPISREIVACGALQDKDLPEELKKHGISIKKAQRILKNLERTEDFKIPMYCLQVGNICFVGAPGEPFCETGMDIKNTSKMDMTICTCRTNGSTGYFPTRRAYAGGGYERDYTAFGPDCAESIAAAALRCIDKMEKTEKIEDQE